LVPKNFSFSSNHFLFSLVHKFKKSIISVIHKIQYVRQRTILTGYSPSTLSTRASGPRFFRTVPAVGPICISASSQTCFAQKVQNRRLMLFAFDETPKNSLSFLAECSFKSFQSTCQEKSPRMPHR
jgi:hypothetical protein